MRMEEGENIAQYVARIKEVVSAIKDATCKIDDDTVLSKVLRTLLLFYAIRVSAIQELRCIAGNDLTLEGMVDSLLWSYLIFLITNLKLLNMFSKLNYY